MAYDFEAQVTKEDCEEAVQKSSSHCAIATAIEKEIPGAKFISVDIQTIRFSKNGMRYVYLTPRYAQKAILDFDAGLTPKPFKLKLRGGQRTKLKERVGGSHRKAKLVATQGRDRHVPSIVGGRTPPTAKTRREFGLRAFDR